MAEVFNYGPSGMFSSDVLLNTSPYEKITPYRLAVMLFIRSQLELRDVFRDEDAPQGTVCEVLDPSKRQAYAMLCFQLTIGPDLTMKEFQALILSKQRTLSYLQLDIFRDYLLEIFEIGIEPLQNIVQRLDKFFITEPNYLAPIVTRSSVIGIYLREIMVLFKKMSFSQLSNTFEAFEEYLEVWFKSPEYRKRTKMQWSSQDSDSDEDMLPASYESYVYTPEEVEESVGSDLVAESEEESNSNSDCKMQYWTKKQSECFIDQQAKYIQTNDAKSMAPKELQEKIYGMLRVNPRNGKAHYLAYLNSVRARELCGAIDNLCESFDQNVVVLDFAKLKFKAKSQGSAKAPLNLAILHATFGHTDQALLALKETITLAHQSHDNVCLQNALAWMYKLSNNNKDQLMLKSVEKCLDLKFFYLMAHGLQSLAHYRAITEVKPAAVFELLACSDEIAWEHSFTDLISKSHALRSALWCMYGKSDMMLITSQMVLNLNFQSAPGKQVYNGEGTSQGICNTASYLMDRGDYKLALKVLDHAKTCFPHEPMSRTWQLCELVIIFTHSVYEENWREAASAVEQLYAIDKWESQLRKAELNIALRDYSGALSCLVHTLHTEVASGEIISPAVGVRAHIMTAEVQSYSGALGTASLAVDGFLRSLSIAQRFNLGYHVAMVSLHLANLKLRMGLPVKAREQVQQHILTVLTHGGIYDQARALLLLVKCNMACSAKSPVAAREAVLRSGIPTLKKVIQHFLKVDAYSRVKDSYYLLALVYNELKDDVEQNIWARECRLLDESHPTMKFDTLVVRL